MRKLRSRSVRAAGHRYAAVTTKNLVRRLSKWFRRNARDLPWRGATDPYAIWVSEVMLQQTQVKTVLPYWQRWMRALPTIEALANASSARIHKLWEGLGYYHRARNLQKAARRICQRHGGRFPERFEDVLDLPGVGRYTAGAVCSIAFNQPVPILDGNVMRVLSRLYGIGGDPRKPPVNAALWAIAEDLVWCAATGGGAPWSLSPSTLNQALMELGALVCTPRRPACATCPVACGCVALRDGRVLRLPALPARARATDRRFLGFVVQWRQHLLLRQRPAGVVNSHLWEFPSLEVTDRELSVRQAAQLALGAVPSAVSALCRVRHSITRYRITLDVFRVQVDGARSLVSKNGARWVTIPAAYRLPFSASHKKVLRALTSPGRPKPSPRTGRPPRVGSGRDRSPDPGFSHEPRRSCTCGPARSARREAGRGGRSGMAQAQVPLAQGTR